MKLRFTRTATCQLDEVLAEIARHSPPGAGKVQQRIKATVQLLLQHPFAWQATERQGIRRIVVTPYPYVLTYRVGMDEVVVRTVRQAARRSRVTLR